MGGNKKEQVQFRIKNKGGHWKVLGEDQDTGKGQKASSSETCEAVRPEAERGGGGKHYGESGQM